ncbi:ABC transporter substrate-binding protein [Microlunatus soli]|uniref:ABC transporter substrate-binding protein n=1 Tax=Microlunatus soli TaxID=630515 RepID=UPI0012F73B3F|nr:ABC transporter substrate-binding protein [Microlunatus soli]
MPGRDTPELRTELSTRNDSGHTRIQRGHAPTKKRAVALVVAAAAISMTAAACTAGTAGGGAAGGAAAGGGGSAAAGDSSKFLTYSPCCSWNTTWSFNRYNVNGLGITDNLINVPLAIQKAPSLTEYEPQLAESWDTAPGKLTVHLRKAAKWEDGTPVTSKDVYDTAILDATRGDGFWNDITKIETPDEHTVVYTLKKGQPMALAQADIFGMLTYASSVYGKFVTPQLEKDVFAYWTAYQKDPDKAAKMPEFKRMSAVFKKLAAYKVDKVIGNGPFKLENITTKEAKLPKSDTFWAADKIKFGGLDYLNGANETIYPQLFSNRADFSNVYLPPPILKRWNKTPESNTALPLAFGFVMGFNSHKYPLNIKEVRQALAYVIPRQQISDAAYGTGAGAGGTWKEVNTGISPSLEKLYLPQDKINQLNKYPVDPAKATELLKSQGFTKKGDQWMTPKGKPFKLTFTANSGTSDIVTSFNSASKALTAFGIKSDVNATSGAQQDADQHNGDFDIGMYLVGGNNPLGVYNTMLHDQNYTASGNYAGKRGIGFGPKTDVPGLGNVNVPNTIYQQSKTVAPGPEMNKQVWNWAQLVNEDVPYIWYATKVYQFEYSETNFTNWPPKDKNGTSPLWDIVGANMSGGMSLAFQQGYVVPKK